MRGQLYCRTGAAQASLLRARWNGSAGVGVGWSVQVSGTHQMNRRLVLSRGLCAKVESTEQAKEKKPKTWSSDWVKQKAARFMDKLPRNRELNAQMIRQAQAAERKRLEIQAMVQRSSPRSSRTKQQESAAPGAEIRVLNMIPSNTKLEMKLLHKKDPEYWTSVRLANHFHAPLANVKGILLLDKIKADLEEIVPKKAHIYAAARAQDLWETLPAPGPEMVPMNREEFSERSSGPNFELFDDQVGETVVEALERRGVKGTVVGFYKEEKEGNREKDREDTGAATGAAASDGNKTAANVGKEDAEAALEQERVGKQENQTQNPAAWLAEAEAEEDEYWRNLESKNHYKREHRERRALNKKVRGKYLRTRWVFIDTSKLPEDEEHKRRVFVREPTGVLHEATAREKKKAQGARGVPMKRRTALDVY
ncbi:hypothetical protein FVE85_0892 [Porphyridium purpureum]|uniref:Uncharacterized protein n=1 Tax=Porphyridium purpureum TaxID=35688 RepID=A0A5J4Z2M1_PORPP|nr:hypothetical protein FVE85_0892 [Porphyridium purpureum]|eukprot:POR9456..scf208_2